MSAFFKAFADRVIKSYRSTLIGLAAGVGLVLIEQFAVAAQSSAKPWLQALAAVAVIVGAALKSKALPPAP
jgi:hypothetical protein